MQRSERDAEWFRYRPGSRLASNLLRLAVLVVYAGVPVLLCAFSLSPYAGGRGPAERLELLDEARPRRLRERIVGGGPSHLGEGVLHTMMCKGEAA